MFYSVEFHLQIFLFLNDTKVARNFVLVLLKGIRIIIRLSFFQHPLADIHHYRNPFCSFELTGEK